MRGKLTVHRANSCAPPNLVLEPVLLILDEPTEGIQPNIVHEIGDICSGSTARWT
jgi:ABC-type branched-subunit amino acid transport system ATPase component